MEMARKGLKKKEIKSPTSLDVEENGGGGGKTPEEKGRSREMIKKQSPFPLMRAGKRCLKINIFRYANYRNGVLRKNHWNFSNSGLQGFSGGDRNYIKNKEC